MSESASLDWPIVDAVTKKHTLQISADFNTFNMTRLSIMQYNFRILISIWIGSFFLFLSDSLRAQERQEAYRPDIHFTPQKGWMNDPNGMFLLDGVYHIFYQHHPYSTVWGPMHWGHATSRDLIHWEHQPIALYPDSLGTIFSGSIVIDKENSSGLGVNGAVPIIAIFTQHDQLSADAGKVNFQTQGIAYSLDGAKTWIKYTGNPVLRNPGIRDFRDPKVFWHEQSKRWIMTLAVLDRIHFYSSSNLLQWDKLSEFGVSIGAHGGVWECPDLFSIPYNGDTHWVLLVNLNPGGPNGGSATQYFIGSFDGKDFRAYDTLTRWADYGPDEYAGVTFHNTGNKRIFMGWMSNWSYANQVPTRSWRSALTIARELNLDKVNGQWVLCSRPYWVNSKEEPIVTDQSYASYPQRVRLDNLSVNQSFSIVLQNTKKENLTIAFDASTRTFSIDRRFSGQTQFSTGFAGIHTAPLVSDSKQIDLELIIDQASVELFADRGRTVMTSIFFPTEPFSLIRYSLPEGVKKQEYRFK